MSSLIMGDHTLHLVEGLYERIISASLEGEKRGKAVAWLFGFVSNSGPQSPESFTVTSVSFCQKFVVGLNIPDIKAEAADLKFLVPEGLVLLGLALSASSDDIKNLKDRKSEEVHQEHPLYSVVKVAASYCQELSSLLYETEHSRSPVILLASDISQFSSFLAGINSVKEISATQQFSSSKLWEDHCLLRCQLSVTLPFFVKDVHTTEEAGAAMGAAIGKLLQQLQSKDAAFLVEPQPAVANEKAPPGAAVVFPQAEETEGTVRQLSQGGASITAGNGNGQGAPAACGKFLTQESWWRTPSGLQLPLPVKLAFLLKQAASDSSSAGSAPVLQYLPVNGAIKARRLRLSLDALAIASRHLALQEAVRQFLVPALCRQLAAMQRLAAGERGSEIKMGAHHFCPPGYPHPVTAVYPLTYGEAEKRSVETRVALHKRLGLPLDRPMLRIANALSFAPEQGTCGAGRTSAQRLQDVHVGLSTSGVAGGTKSLVDGSYEYYHYMQDRIDDNGWGCAYRSLQTIVSWFRLQLYSSVPVPSHRKVQETLVELGDKERAFVGSSQWIGAIELGYVLDHLLGVTCKVLTVQSGADMPSKGRELARHFQTQGTPVMIGGGVLAYTLLGVDYNELTGDCAFLILDPHYTGGEDLKSIRSGGWVGWKKAVTETGQDFFVRNAFYNLLLPQRPAAV